ncbi:hypothetical protein [Spirosoma areae]
MLNEWRSILKEVEVESASSLIVSAITGLLNLNGWLTTEKSIREELIVALAGDADGRIVDKLLDKLNQAKITPTSSYRLLVADWHRWAYNSLFKDVKRLLPEWAALVDTSNEQEDEAMIKEALGNDSTKINKARVGTKESILTFAVDIDFSIN